MKTTGDIKKNIEKHQDPVFKKAEKLEPTRSAAVFGYVYNASHIVQRRYAPLNIIGLAEACSCGIP